MLLKLINDFVIFGGDYEVKDIALDMGRGGDVLDKVERGN